MSDLVGNPEDLFSYVMAHKIFIKIHNKDTKKKDVLTSFNSRYCLELWDAMMSSPEKSN